MIKTANKLNDVKNKISKTTELKEDLERLNQEHPEGVYLSGALLMFAGKNHITYMELLQMIIVISYRTIICNMK